ncbi:hypothetical protein [uncultured Propionivibrio sp.]|uniref:hypothetical protein n=1 Tax=uncultured Propionivibrio sp. TaxID=426737 RepID=UPI0029C01424|nr:hypothetical protein [uncultured Propionivibrio sp.]
MPEKLDQKTWTKLLKEAALSIGGAKEWHWFSYHFSMLPPHAMAHSIVDACADCERKLPSLGFEFIKDIAAICGKEKHEPHYEQLLQKLAELLVLRKLLMLDWPAGTTFQHEPAVSVAGKRPELRVVTPDRRFLFEVKTPSLLEHIRTRRTNAFQVAGRALPMDKVGELVGDGGLTLPRDNPVKDFLLDADKKFAQFKAVQAETSVLVIVWDDFIYEPITVLKHEQCGLLTKNSYLKDKTGAAVQFAHVDAVVVVRHLTYLYRAAGDQPLQDRAHALDFGDENSLPNVFIPISDTRSVPDRIRQGLRAVSWNDPSLQKAADYRPSDIVFWV